MRRTHNPNDGFSNVSKNADYETVAKRFEEDGCSVGVASARWSDKLWALLSNLENFWQSPTGCNAYWTPAIVKGLPHIGMISMRCVANREGGRDGGCIQREMWREVSEV